MKTWIGAAAIAAIVSVGGVSAAETKDAAKDPMWLFTQSAEEAALEGDTLTLSGVGHKTLYFADAPGRVVGFLEHDRFITYWHSDESGWLTNPPNAALVMHTDDVDAPVILNLSDVALSDGDLVYTASLLEGDAATISGPVTIIIDPGSHPLFRDDTWASDDIPPCNPHEGFFKDFLLCLK
ncbi:MAG: hypothetical protein AAFY02_16900 [Pseudomonadota bacterium]